MSLTRAVPEDITVGGYDNIYALTLNRVSLRTVDQTCELTGTASARLLLERIEGPKPPTHHVNASNLIVRGTSGPPSDFELQ